MQNVCRVYKIAKQYHGVLDAVLGSDLEEHLNSKIAEVLSQVFKQVHDPKALQEDVSSSSLGSLNFARPNPPYSNAALANNLVDFFEGIAKK